MTNPSSSTIVAPGATDAKPWYLSKGVIGGLIAVAIPIISIWVPALRVADPKTVTDWVMKIIDIAGPVVGGLIAVYGRVQATQPIAGTKAAQTNLFGGGALPLPAIVGSMLDLPLNSIAADLPQVLLTLQNVGQVISAAAPGVEESVGNPKSAVVQPKEKEASEAAGAPASGGAVAFTPAHLEALSGLIKELVDAAPRLTNRADEKG